MRPSLTHLGRWLGAAALLAVSVQPALAQRNVTLRLNSATVPDTIVADTDLSGVQVRGNVGDNSDGADTLPDGNVIDWNESTTLRPDNVGGDYWSVSFQIPDDEQLDFKFYFDQSEQLGIGGWEDGDNHLIEAGTGDVELELHYFNKTGGDLAYDWRPFTSGADSVAVWFRVFASTEQSIERGYDADDDALVVGVRGSEALGASQDGGATIIDWGTTNITLNRESDDASSLAYNFFSGRVAFPASAVGQTQEYKFVFSDTDTEIGWEDTADGNNRSFTVPAADTTLYWQPFGDSDITTEAPVTAFTAFVVEVSPLTQAGLFQTGADQMQVRGGFNGWDCPDEDQSDCLLNQIPGTTRFARSFPQTAIPGSESNYKFFLDFDEEYSNPDVGYEEPLDSGGSNRLFVFTGNNQAVPEQRFNDVRDDNVIPAGVDVDVTFQVNMAAALEFEGRAFDPAVDTVTVHFEDPVWMISQGFPPDGPGTIQDGASQYIRGFQLTDLDSDGIYTGTLPISGPSYNGIGYRYAFGNDDDGIVVEGSGGFNEGRRRYRYTRTDAGATTLALDVFRPTSGSDADTKMPWEANPTGDVDPDDDTYVYDIAPGTPDPFMVTIDADGLPTTVEGGLSLSAAYPNPTGDVARMAVSVARDEMVTVRVFDVTGRQVALLTDGFQTAGSQTVEFDASALASGVYLVRAEAGADVVTRRLTVTR